MKFLSSETAVSEVVGHAIILGITVIGISMILLYGVPAIYSLEDMANVKNVEQAFTVLDSRASRVTLGESPLQITSINIGGGTLTVEPDSSGKESYMTVKSSSFDITIPMGRVKYQLGDRIVAYEGGGVWSQYPGGSVMLSPPEFHYNGVTLTIPGINIYGNASIGGKGTVAVSFKKNATNAIVVHYPTGYANRINPVNYTQNGKVYVNITSDYYDAWADYAESLGYTKVSVNDATSTTDIELMVVPSTLGKDTSITNPITFRGLDTNDDMPLDNFSFWIKDTNFNNFNWQLTAVSGTKTLIFELKKGTDIGIGYKNTGLGYSKPAEVWTKLNAFIVEGNSASVDLLNKSINLTYVTNENVGTTNPCEEIKNTDVNSSGFSGTTQNSIYNITQHYISLMAQEGDISLNQCSPANRHDPESGSTMLIDYNATGALTYLHITENRADVGIS